MRPPDRDQAGVELAEGVWRVRVPLPLSYLRYVSAYLFRTTDGFVVIDPGWDTREARRTLLQGFHNCGLKLRDLRGILVTHAHADHVSLSGWLQKETGAWVAAGHQEWKSPWVRRDVGAVLAERKRYLGECGVAADEFAGLLANWPLPGPGHQPPVINAWLAEGDMIDTSSGPLRVIATPGHSPGHVCFLADDRAGLFCGDHILARVTSHIAGNGTAGSDPLGDYLSSLDRVGGMHGLRALPGHGPVVEDLGARAHAVREHHRRRLDNVTDAVGETPHTPWDTAQNVQWFAPWAELGPGARRAAVSETLAHLDHLVSRGTLALVQHGPRMYSHRARREEHEGSRVSTSGGNGCAT